MAKRGGNDALKVLGALVLVGILIYLQTGRGKDNSPLLPDAIEDPIDRLIAALNQRFGNQWVNFGLDALQAFIVQTRPDLVALVNAVYRAERAYGRYAGAAKKQAALQYAYVGGYR